MSAFLLLLVAFAAQEVVAVKVDAPKTVRAGDTLAVIAVFDIEDAWHIYAPTGNNASQGMIETKMRLRLPKGFTLAGRMALPEHTYAGPFEVYEGKGVTLRQPVLAGKALKPGKYPITVSITYQPCDPNICLQPITQGDSLVVVVK